MRLLYDTLELVLRRRYLFLNFHSHPVLGVQHKKFTFKIFALIILFSNMMTYENQTSNYLVIRWQVDTIL